MKIVFGSYLWWDGTLTSNNNCDYGNDHRRLIAFIELANIYCSSTHYTIYTYMHNKWAISSFVCIFRSVSLPPFMERNSLFSVFLHFNYDSPHSISHSHLGYLIEVSRISCTHPLKPFKWNVCLIATETKQAAASVHLCRLHHWWFSKFFLQTSMLYLLMTLVRKELLSLFSTRKRESDTPSNFVAWLIHILLHLYWERREKETPRKDFR